ncbi:MAG TPA: hypothetical protein VFQ21_07605 [Gemmatimonadota bacterium]|jgi:hypothetical protein|nr:hypothetical protein [Gemmatimonadota bacterium]
MALASKWLLYVLLAVVDFVAASFFYANGRIVVPSILVLAGVCFTIAAVGAVRGKG